MPKKTALSDQFRRQWHACKLNYPDTLILIGGVGNLTYYTFDEDADRIRGRAHVRALDDATVALGSEYAGPIIAALVEDGVRVAMADQMEGE